MNKEGYSGAVFIQKNDGTYDSCGVIVMGGIQFYPADDRSGWYDSWGNFFDMKPNSAERE